MKKVHWLYVLAVALVGLASTGCDETVEGFDCAEGTTEVDGECVIDSGMICGEGTELQGTQCVATGDGLTCAEGTTEVNGECVSDTMCGTGTTPNNEGECVPDSMISCGEGTTEVNGECVSDLECAVGTVADENGDCVPNFDLVCGAGTVLHEGACLDPIEVLRMSSPVDEGTEPNDPRLVDEEGLPAGGPATDFDLAEVGSSVVLQGTIGTPDALGSDWDGWTFTSTEPGQVIRVTGVSAGLPAPFFALLGDLDGDFDDVDFTLLEYQRTSPSNEEVQPWRDVVLPVPGTYYLFVTDYANAAGASSGSPEYEYFMIVETLPALSATGATQATLGSAQLTADAEGQKVIHENVLHVMPEGAAEQLATVERSEFDFAYAFQTLLLFDPADMSYVGQAAFTFCIDGFFGPECYLNNKFGLGIPDGGYLVALDYESASGFAEQGVTVSFDTTPTLPSDTTGTLDNGGFDLYETTVAAGTMLEVVVTGNQDVQPLIQVLTLDGVLVNQASDDDADLTTTLRWLFTEEATVQVIVADGTFEDPAGTDYGYTLTADMIPVADLGTIDPAGGTNTITDTSTALDASGDDTAWVSLGVIPDSPGQLTFTVSDPTAEVGFSLWLQQDTSFTLVAEELPEFRVSTADVPMGAEGVLVAQLVALTGSSNGVEVEASFLALTTYSGDGDLCSDAVTLAGSGTFVVELTNYTSTLDGSGLFGDCDGTTGSAQEGADSFFIVDVPAGSTLTVAATGAGAGDGGADALIAILDYTGGLCANLGIDSTAFTCLAYNDDINFSAGIYDPEVSWTNSTGASNQVMVVVDNWYPVSEDDDANVVTVTIE